MARFVSPFDIWQVPDYIRPHIQPGQWVYAGDRTNVGMFLGATARTAVVAWRRNINAHADRNGYLRTLRQYAKGIGA